MILCMLLFNSAFAQKNQLPGQSANAGHFTPGGLLDTALDYLGNKYSLGQIAINNEIRLKAGVTPKLAGESMGFSGKGKPGAPGKSGPGGVMHPLAPTIVAPCTPGYFQLYLEAGCGMDDASNPVEVARLAVMCQVLTDISSFIPSPCTTTGQKVNIWVQNPGPGGGFLGEATPFFSVPYSTTASGIADNMIWITINSGRDAWTNVTAPLYSSGSYSSFYHGSVAFQFDGSVNWNTNLGMPPAAGQYDLYTVALHEMLHAIGFHTLINYDGTSIFGSGFQYYSRYDPFLQTSASVPLLAHTGTCSVYDWQFNPSLTPFTALSPGWTSGTCPTGYQTGANTDHTACLTANKYVDGSMTVPVYSPSCFERGGSLSHFEDECYAPTGFPLAPPASNNQYFAMSNEGVMGLYIPTTNPGAMKRYPQPEERQALCDLGYKVNTTFGSVSNLNLKNYTGGVCPGLQVAGINDGISPGGGYMYFTTGITPVDINAGTSGTTILINDFGAVSFKCLEIVNGSGFVSSTLGTSTTPVNFTPAPGASGVQLLRYIPVNASGVEGNITYVYVYVGQPGCTPTACDMVPNGGFEMAVPGVNGDILANPGILYCWEPFIGSPDLFTRMTGPGDIIPDLTTTPITEVHFPGTTLLHPNDHFIDMAANYGNWEGAQCGLTSPLINGNSYTISCWARIYHATGLSYLPAYLQFSVSTSPTPLVALSGGIPPAVPAGVTPIWDLLVDAPAGPYDWKYYTYTFTYSGPTAYRLCIYQAPFLNPYTWGSYTDVTIIDDVSIRPTSSVATFTPPSIMCSGSPLFDLNTAVSIPGGTFSWQTVSGGVVVTSNSNWFDPAAAYNASILSGGIGVATVCYEYTDNLGCVQNICADIISGTIPPISGASHVCIGSTTTLTDLAGGGTWLSTNTGVATINSVTGVVFGLNAGTTIISYTIPCGTVTMTLTVDPLPAVYSVTGGGSHCLSGTGVHIGLSGSSTGVNYQLWLGGSAVGAPISGSGSPIDFGIIAPSGTYTVVATNPVTGCSSNMTGSAIITIIPGPTGYTVTGGGSFCPGGTGVHVGLSSSDPGISYQLFIGGSPGAILAGTGIALDFGLQTTIATYTIVATDPVTGCTTTMTGTAIVSNYPLPTPYTVSGGGSMCVGAPGLHIYLSNSDIGIDYQLYCGGTPIGAVMVGTGAMLDFGIQTSGCTYTVIATSVATGCTNSMTGSAVITVNPLPAIYTVTGGGAHCMSGPGVHIGLSGSTTGVNYQLWFGGTAIGSPVAGTGIAIDFGLIMGAGTYTVIATDATTGCISNMTGSAVITIIPGPVPYTVTGGGSYCPGGIGVHVGLSSSDLGINYQLFIGGSPGAILAGTGIALDFGLQTTLGTYTIVATDPTTGCTTIMTSSAIVSHYPLPTPYTVSGGGSMCAGGTGLHIYLSGSASGISYQLYCGAIPIGIPISGTGSLLDFGLQTSGCIYTVVATNTTTGCSNTMTGSAVIIVYPVPAPISGPHNICMSDFVYLTDAVSGGTWSSSVPAVASIDVATGLLHGIATGSTIITYTSPGGCYVIFPVTVGTLPITGPNIVCVGSTITLTDAATGGTWTSSNTGVATIDVSTGIVTGVSAGTTTITYTTPCGPVTYVVTVINPKGACVCSLATVHPFTEIDPLGTGVISGIFGPGNYYINHPLTVTSATTFLGCKIVMAPGITITVSSTAKLTIISSHLFCCYPDMWQGIVLSTSSLLGPPGASGQLEIMDNGITTLIEDAMVAVDIPSPVAMAGYTPGTVAPGLLTFYSHGCTFNKNIIGVRISGYNASMPVTSPTAFNPSYPFVMKNTVFTCRDFYPFTDPSDAWPFTWPSTAGPAGALKNIVPILATPYDPPYVLNTYGKVNCNNGVLSTYGIDLDNVAYETGSVGSEVYSCVVNGGQSPTAPTDLNLFDHMNYGIYAHNSNLLTRNSGFMNMVNTPVGGDGIYAFKDGEGLYKLHVYGNTSGSYTNTFWSNVNCVEASEYYDVVGLRAVMYSQHESTDLSDPQGQYGYKVSSAHYYEEQINFNSIYNIGTGISITTTLPLPGISQYIGQSTVSDNHIAAVYPFSSSSFLYNEYMQQAVNIVNLATPVSTGIFPGSQQNVDRNEIRNVYNGISMLNSNVATNAQSTTAYRNIITLVPDPTLVPGSSNQTGINHTSTRWDYINENTVTGVAYNIPAPSWPGTYYTAPMIEGIHVANVTGTKIEVGCNHAIKCNTGFYFGGHNTNLQWRNNEMAENSYGLAIDGDIGMQGAPLQTTGNYWTSTVLWSWIGTGRWHTYTIGATDAALSFMWVKTGIFNQQPTNNFGESSLMYDYTGSYGMNHVTPHPIPPCQYPPASSVPEAMRPGGSDANFVDNTVKITDDLLIIPNPNKGTFTLKGIVPEMTASKQVTLEVLDVLGRTLYSENSSIENGIIDKKVVMSDNIASGTYFVRIKSEESSKVLRFTLTR
ncbi:MAG: Conserved repeat domain protein [Flavipsychrobacter sp.]|nr:Conserved repeat domain protein [Flavipsychrobacter sp.]